MFTVHYDSPEARCSAQMKYGAGEGRGQGKFSRRDTVKEHSGYLIRRRGGIK